jgi:cell division transport system permease protein
MSMIEPQRIAEPEEEEDLPPPPSPPAARAETLDEPLPSFEAPIVPRGTISARALTAVVAIMTFLASLTTGAVMMVRAAALDWQSDVAREVTIQVRAASGRDLEADVVKSVAIARAFEGVAEVRALSKEESSALIEPWLGSGIALDDLPVPRIILVRIAPGLGPDFAHLRRLLAAEVPSATLDDHRGFVERMRVMAQTAVFAGLGVLALVVIANMLSVTFATRGAMATNRPVIEVLHFIGAKKSFISWHFQRHFLLLGLKGGLIGGGLACAVFALAEFAQGWFAHSAAGEQFTALFGTFSIGALGYAAVAGQVVLIAGVTALTSRATVNRTLETIQ